MEDFWQKQHDVVGSMTEWERGWYKAVIESALWNSHEELLQPLEGGEIDRFRIPVDGFDGKWVIARYSPSGSQQRSESFYSPEPLLADDTVEILFSEDKFRAMWTEVDSEAMLQFYYIEYHLGEFMDEIQLVYATTESNLGLPESWDVWPEVQPSVVVNHKEEAEAEQP